MKNHDQSLTNDKITTFDQSNPLPPLHHYLHAHPHLKSWPWPQAKQQKM